MVKDYYLIVNDMVIMVRELMKYLFICKYIGKYEDYLCEDMDKKFWFVNMNKLVCFYFGVDGVKIGFMIEVKYCLIVLVEKNGMCVILVVMGVLILKEWNN